MAVGGCARVDDRQVDDDPLLTPLATDPSGLPPILVQAPTGDSLAPEAHLLVERGRAAGVEIDLELYPATPYGNRGERICVLLRTRRRGNPDRVFHRTERLFMNSARWPSLPYEAWSATCDTLHAHAQILGKLAVALAPPEPQLQHAALHLTARGWETQPLPAPDRSGSLVVALDLHRHHAVAEHSDGRVHAVALTPDRPVADVTHELLAAVTDLVGALSINTTPQETAW